MQEAESKAEAKATPSRDALSARSRLRPCLDTVALQQSNVQPSPLWQWVSSYLIDNLECRRPGIVADPCRHFLCLCLARELQGTIARLD